MDFSFMTPPEVRFESGGAARIGELVRARMDRPVFVTDKGVINAGLVGEALESLGEAGLDVLMFDAVEADPPARVIRTAVAMAKEHNADGVIGFGGGSSLDTAKLIAVLMDSSQSLEDIYGVDNVRGHRAPLVLLPTTSGTGSEVTNISVVTSDDDRKVGIVASQLFADAAIVDAKLTLTAPRSVTAATGIDAMVHAIEAYTSRIRRNPVSSALAREALGLLANNLLTACNEPDNLAAREALSIGATIAGQAFTNAPVAAVHAMAYPLGAIFHIPHGVSNALMLPPVLKFNAAVASDLYAELGPVVGVAADVNAFINRMVELCEASGTPLRLKDVGVNHNDLPRMAEDAAANERLMQNNPRPVSYEDALKLYSEVL
jgi:alcohol dehydrogenase class IV